MKKLITGFLSIIYLTISAQTFPFDEGFYGIPTYTLPQGWTGDMNVQPYHGLNEDKGLAATIGSTDKVDSAETPWIGPLAANTEVIFWYRMVDDFIFPSTERQLKNGDRLDLMFSTDSINYTSIYTVDSSNHIATVNFRKITFTNTNYGGQVVKLKLRAQHGSGGSYYVDVDSIKIREKFVVGISEEQVETDLQVFPNPVNSGAALFVSQADAANEEPMEVYNAFGELIFSFGKEDFITAPSTPGIYLLRAGDRIKKIIVQ